MVKWRYVLIAATVITALLLSFNHIRDKSEPSSLAFPAKPITLIVPFAAGGGTDLLARSMEKLAAKHLGQPLVVVNKPGAGGTLAWNELAGSNPDGYTIGLTITSMILQPLYNPTRYHYLSALDPVDQIVSLPILMVVKADQPWRSVSDVIQYARTHPNELKFGHGGLGIDAHIAGEMFVREAKVQIEQVPFLGGSEAVAALLGGHVSIVFGTPPAVIEHVKAGTLRVLASTSEKHSPEVALQNIPTFQEQGYPINFSSWFGLAIPKGVPKEVKEKLVKGFDNLIHDPEFVEMAEKQGLIVDYLNDNDSLRKWLAQNEELRRVVEETGLVEKIRSQKK